MKFMVMKMSDLDRLEMLVNHMIQKEDELVDWLVKELEYVSKIKENTDNYSLRMNWTYYENAIKKVLKKIEKLERVDKIV